MEYTIQKLAELAGISTRTLRYYDEIGLLPPCRYTDSGYRIYSEGEVDALQQILFYRELQIPLETVKQLMQSPDYNRLETLSSHLEELVRRRQHLDLLIQNVTNTIKHEKGDYSMTDKEKFEGLKKELVQNNETAYGQEIREKYGNEQVERSNARFMNLTEDQYAAMEQLTASLQEKLEDAVNRGVSPNSQEGRAIALLHKEWLSYSWPSYTLEAHKGLAQMYVADERFTAYYDKNQNGCARFLSDAITSLES